MRHRNSSRGNSKGKDWFGNLHIKECKREKEEAYWANWSSNTLSCFRNTVTFAGFKGEPSLHLISPRKALLPTVQMSILLISDCATFFWTAFVLLEMKEYPIVMVSRITIQITVTWRLGHNLFLGSLLDDLRPVSVNLIVFLQKNVRGMKYEKYNIENEAKGGYGKGIVEIVEMLALGAVEESQSRWACLVSNADALIMFSQDFKS